MYLQNVQLSKYSTIQMGGPAAYFKTLSDLAELREIFKFANGHELSLLILGEGSNCLFADQGFNGLVLKNDLKGITLLKEDHQYCYLEAASGENWDNFVKYAVERGLSGIECLSGIPGSVGATPIQNVGAYGQEVSQTIETVRAVCLKTYKSIDIDARACGFSYRHSRFKEKREEKFFIKSVIFKLYKKSVKTVVYQEILQHLKARYKFKNIHNQRDKLVAIRRAVIDVRKNKSMVIDSADVNSKSLGSFFTNPVLSKKKYQEIKPLLDHITFPCPTYKFEDSFKASAAWLIENSGFRKGHIYKNIGLSENHCLAIVNRKQGSASEVLELANLIQKSVKNKFKIDLTIEPNII